MYCKYISLYEINNQHDIPSWSCNVYKHRPATTHCTHTYPVQWTEEDACI